MKSLFLFWVALVTLLAPLSVNAQPFTTDETLEDLRFLMAEMENSIPCLLEYNPNFRSEAETILATVDGPATAIEHFELVTKLAALGNEGHTKVIDVESKLWQDFLEDRFVYLPLVVKFIGDRLFVEQVNVSTSDLRRGLEITQINGQSLAEIIDLIAENTPSDGRGETFTRLDISNGFNWRYYLFVEQPAAFELSLHDPATAESFTTTIPATTLGAMRAFRAEQPPPSSPTAPEPESNVYELRIEADHAYLRLQSFDWRRIEKENLKPKELYGDLFARVKAAGVDHLIVDLRGNTGGRNEFSTGMIPFINQTDAKGILKTSISWKGKSKVHKIPRPDRNVFDGRIIVLTDGKTYSAGGTLARYLKEFGRAIVVGEETGTRYEGFAAGSANEVQLPHSGLKLQLPRYHTKFPVSSLQTTSNRGLLPDHHVPPSYEDWINGTDAAYEKAISLIRP